MGFDKKIVNRFKINKKSYGVKLCLRKYNEVNILIL